jgi:hypothetical protein
MAFPLPERLRTFLRTHTGHKEYAGGDIEWLETEDLARRDMPPQVVSELIGDNMAHYLEWLSGYLDRKDDSPEDTAAVRVLAEIVDQARRAIRWHEKEARAATAYALAAHDEPDEPWEDEGDFAPQQPSETGWDPTEAPDFH